MTPSELMTAAADRLDALLAEATPGPWRTWPGHPGTGIGGLDHALSRPTSATVHICTVELGDAAYIAAMNPDVGRALAALLRWTAERWVDAKAVQHHSARAEMQDLALDLARAILGTREDT